MGMEFCGFVRDRVSHFLPNYIFEMDILHSVLFEYMVVFSLWRLLADDEEVELLLGLARGVWEETGLS